MAPSPPGPAVPTPGGPPKLGRRTYVIDRGFQLKYTLTLVAVGAGVSVLFGVMMYLAHADAARGIPIPAAFQEEWARNDSVMIGLTAAMTVLMAVALGLFGILITHRVAGPVYVMSHYITVLSHGRYPVMRPLRKKDELKTFFERFQTAIESLRTREAEEAKTLDLAVRTLSTVANTPELEAALGELRTLRDRKKDATDRVQLGPTPEAAK